MHNFRVLYFLLVILSTFQNVGSHAATPIKKKSDSNIPALVHPASVIAPTKVASVEGITEYRLANGLRVLLFPDASKANITTNITYLVGSRHENYGETGMAHLLEHLVFKPSKKFSGKNGRPNIVQVLNQVGARFNGTTWLDRTNYFVTFPANDANLRLILDMEADRMVNANIDQKDLWDPVEKKGEMTVVRNEMEGVENNPLQITLQRTVATAFEWHNYGKSTIGARSDVENVDIERLRAFYRNYYQPDNAVLLVAGKIDEEKTLALINETFGPIPKPTRAIKPTYTLDPVQDGERSVTVRRVGDVQILMAAYKIPAGVHTDFSALAVLGQILADTPSGRLHKALVDTKKAAFVFPFISETKEPGLAIFGAQLPKETDLNEAREIMLKVLEQGLDTISQEEVERAKTQLLKDIELTLNESDKLGVSLSEFIAQGDWRLFFLQRDRIQKITVDQVRAAGQYYFKKENRTLGQFIPTLKPDRAEIASTPDAAALVKNYQGGQRIAAGEVFDASAANIDLRTTTFATPSGLQVAMLSKKTRGQTVNATLQLHFGNEKDLQGYDEIGGITAAMLMRGTVHRSRQQIADELDRLKAQVRLVGSAENLIVSITTTGPNLPAVLDLVAEVLRKPAFDPQEFAKEVNEQITAYEERRNEPANVARTALLRHISPYSKGHPRYAATIDEAIAEIKSLKIEDVRAFHRDFYGAVGQMALVGDFDSKAVQTQLTRLLGEWKAPKNYQRIAQRLKKDLQPLDIKLPTPDKAQAIFLAALPLAIKDDNPDYPALVLGNYMLGGGAINSRIANRLRQKEGLSYGASSQFAASAQDPVGQWSAMAIYAPQNMTRLETAFNEELVLVLKEGFTREEMQASKTSWLQNQATSRSQDRELANRLSQNLFSNRTMAWYADLEAKITALTEGEVLTTLRRYLDPNKLIRVKAGDFSKTESAK
ncbi:MAG: insulinase family protein [Burkholderiaceae bacterium]|nr:insulinase family protein [Burkholderiaceae bacterium]